MLVDPKAIFISSLSLFAIGGMVGYAALTQTVDFSTKDVGYTLSGDGGAGVYGTVSTTGSVDVVSTATSFSVAPTGFSGNFFALERPDNVNSTVYTPQVQGETLAAVYVTLPSASGSMTNGSVTFSFKYAAPNATINRYNSSTSAFLTTQAVMEYRVDGGAWQTALNIQGRGGINNSPSPSPANVGMWWDSNFDDVFTDTDRQITSAATPVSRTISGITVNSSFQARLRFLDGVQEEMAFDDISVTSSQFAAIPEPANYGVMGAGALAGVTLVRRRRRAKLAA